MSLPIVAPIIPRLSRKLPVGRSWRYEVKLDGFRGTLYVQNGRAWFRSKKMNVMRRFQGLADGLAAILDVKSAIFDGEIVVMTKAVPDFYALMFRRGTAEYAAFDLLWLNGRDLRQRRYIERKKLLRNMLARTQAMGYIEHHMEPALFKASSRLDLEGIVAKRVGDLYTPSTEWLKVKHPEYSQAEGRHELFKKWR